MKYFLYGIGAFLAIGIAVLIWNTSKINSIRTVEVVKNDSIYVHTYDTLYIEHIDDIVLLNNKVDSLNSEIFVLKYKLGRIKEYNELAAKNNNIKYLRGWINRVLNE